MRKYFVHDEGRFFQNVGSLYARPRWCPFCTNPWFAFTGSLAPLLRFHIHLALVQTLYRARGSHEFAQISIDGAMRNCRGRGSLLAGLRRSPFAQSHCLHFQVYQHLSFLFTCTLHWCKHCTGLEVAPNLGKFPLTALCVIAAEVLVCLPVLVDALFAPSNGLHFQTQQHLGFLFICTLRRCKRCTRLEVAPNLRKFPLRTQCVFAEKWVVCKPVLVGALSAPSHG